jgi:hypothetical protein
MKKKGVELSMNVIIIAAIGLLVLVILAVLVINSGTKTVTGMKTCNALGGICKVDCGTDKSIDNGVCSDTTTKCCQVFSVESTQ